MPAFFPGAFTFWQNYQRAAKRRGPIQKLLRPYNIRVNRSKGSAEYLRCWGSRPGVPCPKKRGLRRGRGKRSAPTVSA